TKINENDMIDLVHEIGTEEYLSAMPVLLADVANVEDARRMSTTFNLGSMSESVQRQAEQPHHFDLSLVTQCRFDICFDLLPLYVLDKKPIENCSIGQREL
ncbi:hypothetical protein C0992_012945, partial [Termitomyces sp. T32_za158]